MNIILNNKIIQDNLDQDLNNILTKHMSSYDLNEILLPDIIQEDYLIMIMDKLKILSIQASELDLIQT